MFKFLEDLYNFELTNFSFLAKSLPVSLLSFWTHHYEDEVKEQLSPELQLLLSKRLQTQLKQGFVRGMSKFLALLLKTGILRNRFENWAFTFEQKFANYNFGFGLFKMDSILEFIDTQDKREEKDLLNEIKNDF